VIGFFETDALAFEYAERWFPEGSWSIVEQINPVTYRSAVLGDRSLFDPVLEEERGRLESGDDLDGPLDEDFDPFGPQPPARPTFVQWVGRVWRRSWTPPSP
jgi:hypothetical protein